MVGIVSVILLVVFAIASVLLILVVLIQDEQGEGIGGLFAGGSGASFGPRRGNILTRFTWIVGVVFLVGAFAVAWVNRTPEAADLAGKARIEQLQSGENKDWFVESDASGTSVQSSSSGSAAGGQTTATGAGTQTEAQAPTGSETKGQ